MFIQRKEFLLEEIYSVRGRFGFTSVVGEMVSYWLSWVEEFLFEDVDFVKE